MKEIDWSKAPEGYPIWIESKMSGQGHDWHREEDNCYRDRSGFYWPKEYEGTDYIVHRRPEWNGEDLPPIGIECEVENSIKDCWDKVDEVLAHTSIRGKSVAVFKRDDRVFYALPGQFRPIRTPEQIAAEERDKEVDALCYDIVSHYEAPKMSEHYLGLAKALHAAGYRKVTK